jgi:glycosyltransferase involved in cell wall biosynthesis
VKISVVICTRDRPDTIGQAVESVAECDYPQFDMHIMDQSTNERTRDIVSELAKRLESRCRINYHHLDKAGLSRAYNAGMRVSDGEIIACTDDDVIVPSDWLRQIARAFADDPDAGLLYGQVLVPESLKKEVENGLIVPSLSIPERQRLAKGQGFKVYGMGANMAIRRTLLDRVGGFDEALGGGGPLRSSQDFDFAYRTYHFGMAILLDPDVKVDHYGPRTQDQWPATMKAYGIGDGAFYSKHIRCGDPLALWLFTKSLFINSAREVKRAVKTRRFERNEYLANLYTGIREGSKFSIDRKFRVYEETRDAKMTVSDANVVTAAKRTKSN